MQVLECIKVYGTATLRALGKQWIGLACTLVSMYCVAIPCMALLVFAAKWNVFGIVSGYLIGLAVLCCAIAGIFVTTNWDEECQHAHDRMHKH